MNAAQEEAIAKLKERGFTVRQLKPPPEPWWIAHRGEGREYVGFAGRSPRGMLAMLGGTPLTVSAEQRLNGNGRRRA